MMMKKTSASKKTASKKMPAALKASFMGQHKKMAMGDGMKSGGKAMNMGGYAMKTGGKAHAKSCKCMACGGSVKY